MQSILKKLLYVPLIYVIILLLVIVFYIYLANLPFDEDRIQYAFVVLSRTTAFYLVQISALSFILFIPFYAFLKGKLSREHDVMYAAALILSFISVPLSCWASFFAIVEFGTGFHHLDRMAYDEELYQLALISNPGLGQSSYNLYACDAQGLDCIRVYQLDTSLDTPHADLGNFQTAEQAHLISSSSGQSISIVIDGQSILEYHP